MSRHESSISSFNDSFIKTVIALNTIGGLVIVFGGLSGTLDPGYLGSTAFATAGAIALFVSIVCFVLVTRTSLRADYPFVIAVEAVLAVFYLRDRDLLLLTVALLGIVSLLVTFFRHDGGSFRKLLADIRTPRRTGGVT